MKPEITPRENLSILSKYIIDAFAASAPSRRGASGAKEPGVIQLDLDHRGENLACHFVSDGNALEFAFGNMPNYDVKLTATLYNWLDLAAGRLHPGRGVMTQKLKFEGNTRVFDRLINRESMFAIAADTSDPPNPRESDPARDWRPPGKILVINGSPRGRRGYTFLYLNRFIQGLQSAGGAVETIELGQKKLNPCSGCMHCWKNDTGRCVRTDDGNDMLEQYAAADLVVFAFTLYWDTVPGILKNLIERMFCLEYPYMIPGVWKTRHPRRIKRNQSLFVFSVCGFPEQSHFDPIQLYFKNICHNAHLAYLGGMFRSACMFLHNNPLYFKTYNLVLDSIREAGADLYRFGKIDKKLLDAAQTKIDPREFRVHSNKFWENVVLKKEDFVRRV